MDLPPLSLSAGGREVSSTEASSFRSALVRALNSIGSGNSSSELSPTDMGREREGFAEIGAVGGGEALFVFQCECFRNDDCRMKGRYERSADDG